MKPFATHTLLTVPKMKQPLWPLPVVVATIEQWRKKARKASLGCCCAKGFHSRLRSGAKREGEGAESVGKFID